MARNGSGTYVVPNTFVPNTPISASEINQNFSDVGTAITGSLARDGQSSMTGQLRIVDGTVAAPGIAFANDTNTGFRRATADTMVWVGGGVDRMQINASGTANFFGAVNILGKLNLQGGLSGGNDLAAIEELTGTGLLRRTGTNSWALEDGTTALVFSKDGGGVELPTGILGDLLVPFGCTITAATLLADQAGDAVVDIWKDTTANFPPTNADSITASNEPTLSSAAAMTDSTLTDWTTSIAAGDVLRFNLDSVSTITRLSIILTVKRF